MASQYDASAGTFSFKRLRTGDAAFLAGADRPNQMPNPIAYAEGPFITGPQAGAIGANDAWVCGAAVPAAADLCWVVIEAGVHMRASAGQTEIDAINVIPRGVVTNAAYSEGPQLGPGNAINTWTVASGGTNPRIMGASANRPSEALFIPLDPAWTYLGWDWVVTVVAGAGGGIAQNDARLDMLRCRLVGYPVNVWDTGPLWSTAAMRGS